MDDRQAAGAAGETVAQHYLEGLGWQVIGRNVRYRIGELDIVADDGSQLVFVEVRTRRTASGPRAEDTVASDKRRKLIRAARMYLMRYTGPRASSRFDVVAVDGARSRVMAHHRGAFEARPERGCVY